MNQSLIRTFKDAVAIVTGGASGIGKALCDELASQGCEVIIYDRQIDLAKQVAASICQKGFNAEAIEGNVTDFSQINQLIQKIVNRTGRIDYLFNNAGICYFGDVIHNTIEDWQDVLAVNLNGVINGIQAVYPIMAKQGFGHIVNTASMAGLVPIPGIVSYTASKHAVVGISTSLRVEAASLGIRISVLCPGLIRTQIIQGGGVYGKILNNAPQRLLDEAAEQMHPMEPNVFAKKAIKDIAKNKSIIIYPSFWKLGWWLNRFSPWLGLQFARLKYLEGQKIIQSAIT